MDVKRCLPCDEIEFNTIFWQSVFSAEGVLIIKALSILVITARHVLDLNVTVVSNTPWRPHGRSTLDLAKFVSWTKHAWHLFKKLFHMTRTFPASTDAGGVC